MKQQLRTLTVIGLMVLLVLAMMTGLAFAEEGPSVGMSQISAEGITWQPAVDFDYERIILTVSGPEDVDLRYEFAAGELPAFLLAQPDGKALPIGNYSYALQAVPVLSDAARAAFDAAIESRDNSVVRELQAAGELPAEIPTQSGIFTIEDGQVYMPEALMEAEGLGAQGVGPGDQQILDDLIVDGSICAGQDCSNGESFGFDTIRLKENNLRIRAFDTSNSASFPSNDWQITFNDSSNGGANKFSIDDIDGGKTPFTIEAGARTNALFIEDSGQIGIGTNAPVADLHVKNGNTPTLRLEQDGTSGFTAQTWDLAGNEANLFIRDVTNGSDLPFRIFPNAGTNALVIEGDTGDIGIGTNSPARSLHVYGTDGNTRALVEEASGTNAIRVLLSLKNSGGARLAFADAAGNNWNIGHYDNSGASDFFITGDGGGFLRLTQGGNLSINGTLTTSGSCSTGTCLSAMNAINVQEGQILTALSQLSTVSWESSRTIASQASKDADITVNTRHIAPDVEEFNAVFGLGAEGDASIAPLDVATVALMGIQELQAELTAKDARIAELEARLAALEKMLQELAVTPPSTD